MSTNVTSGGPGRLSLSAGQNGTKSQARPEETGDEIQAILDAIRALKFGEITVIVQDGYIVQVNRLEKRRLR